MIKYQALGGNKEVTGSCHLVEVDNLKILIDFGLIQDSAKSIEEIYKLNSKKLPVDLSEIDYIIITHAHLDHCGKLGMLPAYNFEGIIITTALTSDIMNINLRDATYLHNKEVERINKRRKRNKVLPLFTPYSIEKILNQVRGYSYYQKIVLNDKVTVTLLPSGHLPGACMVYIEYKNGYEVQRVLFTGDTSADLKEIPFTKKPNLEKMKINMIITEGTYGNENFSKTNVIENLKNHIQEICMDNKATLLIPAFSIGRSTNILLYLKEIYQNNPEFNDIPIYLASPMAIAVHKIIGQEENFSFYDEKWKKYRDLWFWDRVNYIDNFEEVKSKLANGYRKIIVASSGMLVGGYSTYLASIFLPHKKSKILLTGYQGEGTIGRKLLEGQNKTVNIDGKPIRIRAKVDFLSGMSSHGSGEEIVKMFSKIEKKKLKKIILTHGKEEQLMGLKNKLQKKFKNVEIIIPNFNEIIKIQGG